MIAALIAWRRDVTTPKMGRVLQELEREAQTERMQSLRWVIDTPNISEPGPHTMKVDAPPGWTVTHIDVEAAGVIPWSGGVLRWTLLRLHLSRGGA